MAKDISAKGIAFEKERLQFRKRIRALEEISEYWQLEFQKEAIIRKHIEEIVEELKTQLEELSKKIGIPTDVLLADIERTKKAESSLNMLTAMGNMFKF